MTTQINQRQSAIIQLFEESEIWHQMGFESMAEAEENMAYDEIEKIITDASHNIEEEIQEVIEEKTAA